MSAPRLAPLLALALVACVSQRVETRDSVEPGADFAALGTWDWVEPDESELDALSLERVRRVVAEALAAKGWRQDRRAPDVRLGVRTSSYRSTVEPGFSDLDSALYEKASVEAGTLVLEAWDPAGRPLWRGTARGALPANPSVEERERRVREAVEGMLRGFPAAAGAPR